MSQFNSIRHSTYQYSPPAGLRNVHIQNIMANVGVRKWKIRYKTRQLRATAQEIILDCGNKTKLLGHYNPAEDQRSLIILLHGWEGCSESSYVLSAAQTLSLQGHSIFRLNFRDHGNSHHLNPEIFHSARLSDVTGALETIVQQFPHEKIQLVGFSLGGNFALRLTINEPKHQYQLHKTIAICPVICPKDTMHSLSNGARIYEQYFVRRWKSSLFKKSACFPNYDYQNFLNETKTLQQMNDYLVPRYTPYSDTNTYLDAYTIAEDQLANLDTPTTIIASEDDPIVSASKLPTHLNSDKLDIILTRHGAHCAFLKNYQLESWVDDRLRELL